MNPILSRVILFGSLVAIVCSTAYRPDWLGDANTFLHNFINHEYLNILGVILAITLASLSQLHLSLNRIEETHRGASLSGTRSEIKSSAWWLIVGFIAGLLLVLCKPIIVSGETGASIVNGLALFILLFYVLVLADITVAVFDLRPDGGDDDTP